MSLFNAGPEPIDLDLGAKLFSLEFHYLDSPALVPYEGQYQNQVDFPADQEEFIVNANTVSLAEVSHLPVEIGHLRQQILAQTLAPSGSPPNLVELAALQGVKRIESAEELVGGWPEDEDVDAFLKSALGTES